MKIKWTTGATLNLKHIEEFIARDNPQAAINMVLKIIKSVELLSDNSGMGKTGRLFDTRELIISGTPFIVPYRVKVGQIQILRVFHGAMQ